MNFPQVGRCPMCYWRRVKKSSRGMKRLNQCGNNAQMWICLVVKVKSNAVKSKIAQEPEMLGPRIKANWKWSNRRWQD